MPCEVLTQALEYRKYRQWAVDARAVREFVHASRFAAKAGAALRRMRKAAAVHNAKAAA